jgi:hypothetical protein
MADPRQPWDQRPDEPPESCTRFMNSGCDAVQKVRCLLCRWFGHIDKSVPCIGGSASYCPRCRSVMFRFSSEDGQGNIEVVKVEFQNLPA